MLRSNLAVVVKPGGEALMVYSTQRPDRIGTSTAWCLHANPADDVRTDGIRLVFPALLAGWLAIQPAQQDLQSSV
jgi:hypothetical protein